MRYANPIDNFEERLTKALTVVSIAESCEAQKAVLELPLRGWWFLNPMAGNSKVTISIAGLPSITRQVNFASNCWTLDKMRQ